MDSINRKLKILKLKEKKLLEIIIMCKDMDEIKNIIENLKERRNEKV
jgi:hypothetical protein